MTTLSRIAFSFVFVGAVAFFALARQPQSELENGYLSEVRFKPFIYLDVADQLMNRYLSGEILKDKNGWLVPVNSTPIADVIVAFVPKTITNPDPITWPAGSISSNHKERMIAYTHAANGRMRLLWFDQAGKKSDAAIKDLLKAIDASNRSAKPIFGDTVRLDDKIGGEITRPVITYKEAATYMSEARNNLVQGVVVLSVVFGANGKLRDIRVLKGLPYGLTASAVQAALKVRFQSAKRDGKEIDVRGNLEYSFNLY